MALDYFIFGVLTMHILSALGLGAALVIALGVPEAQAAGRFYDPANAASPTGKTLGYELFRTIGCPGRELMGVPCTVPDSDGDGVSDELDQCPTTPAGRKVKANGCEPDSDGDGVADSVDACPSVPAQTPTGCPPPPSAVVPAPAPVTAPAAVQPPASLPTTLVLSGVTFDNDQATLRPDAIAILDRAALTLQQWGNVKVEVAGHTDSWSDDAHNLALSQRRAETVRAHLVSRGVAVDRLSARGYGEARPVADNATETGRAQNRRVELVPMR